MRTTKEIVRNYLIAAGTDSSVTVTGATGAIVQSWGDEYKVSSSDGNVIGVVGLEEALRLLGL